MMIECGDSVREIGSDVILKAVAYSSATKQFQVQRGNCILPIRWLPESILELVEKVRTYETALGYQAIPERWILD
jgi:hypothetical protein